MSDLEVVLDLQGLDTRIDQLRHRLSHDPLHAALEAREHEVTELERALRDAERRRDDIRHAQKRLEDESATCGEKIAREHAKLYGGVITAHKELEALQSEIDMLTAHQNGLDDKVIEQMELAEPIDAELAEVRGRLAAAADAVDHGRGEVTVMKAEVGAELDDVSSQRATLAAGVEADLLTTYERLRDRLGGQGAARLAPGGRCEGCHLQLPSADYDAVKRAPAGEMVMCPECGRILVR